MNQSPSVALLLQKTHTIHHVELLVAFLGCMRLVIDCCSQEKLSRKKRKRKRQAVIQRLPDMHVTHPMRGQSAVQSGWRSRLWRCDAPPKVTGAVSAPRPL
ncbi:hypothetical protein V8C43DRAFT_273407 [Trichoderma afarasin]